MTRLGRIYGVLATLALCAAAGGSFAQAGGAPPGGAADQAPVTREEFNRMMQEMNALRQEVADLKTQRAASATQPGAGGADVAELRKEVADLKKQQADNQADNDERAAEIDKVVKDVMRQANANSLGQEKLLITGDASVGFTAQRHNPNTFDAGVSPRFLWKINDQLMFDAGFDVSVGRDDQGNNSTSFDLTIASVTYTLNDYLVLGGGLFVAPFAAYHRDFDPPWITKLPDDPLVFSDGGLAPGSVVGAFVSGAYPIGKTKINYAVYVSNGPELTTSDSSADPGSLGAAGSLGFDNFTDLNNNKAVGGRIGFLPIPELEVGYSVLCGQASPNGFPDTNALLQAVDFNYSRESQMLYGTVSLRSEWVWSHVGDATYDPLGNGGAIPLNHNDRNGGYVMVSYRPTLASYKLLRNFEGIFRYDRMDGPPNTSSPQHEARYTVGLDYWIDPRAVLKLAYECDDIANGGGSPAYMMQFGIGF